MHSLLHLQLQRVHLAQIGKAALVLLAYQVVLLFLLCLLLLDRRGAQGRHLGEEVVKGVLQHLHSPPQQAGHGREEIVEEIVSKEAVPEEALHHPLALGTQPLGIAQLFRAVAAQVLLFHMAVHVAPIHKGNFILTTIFAFHKSIPPIIWKLCVLIETFFPAARVPATPAGSAPAS